MKNTKFFVSTLIAAAAMTATAYSDGSIKGVSWDDDVSAGTRTFTGTVNSGNWVCINGDETSYSSISTDVHTLVFDSVSPSGDGSAWFTNTPVVTQNIQLKGTGLVIDGGTSNGPAVFTGNFLAGDKDASFTWNDDTVGNAQGYRFEGDMTAFNGSFSRMTATSGGDLFFGKESAVSYSSTATDGIISNISGSGSISTTAGVVYNYAAGGDIYTTLSVNNSSIVAEKLTFQGGASYSVSSNVTAGTLTLSAGTLTLGGNTTVSSALSVASGTTLTNTGTLDLSGATVSLSSAISNTGTVLIDAFTVFALDEFNTKYDLVQGGGTIDGTIGIHNFSVEGVALTGRSTGTISNSEGVLSVTVTAFNAAESVTWAGTDSSHVWDMNNATNAIWKLGDKDDAFYARDNATFGTEASYKTVTIGGDVVAGTVSINDDYTFSATADSTLDTGFITVVSGKTLTLSAESDKTLTVLAATKGEASLVKSGAGTVNIANTGNDFSSVSVEEGLLEFGGAVGKIKTLNVESGATLSVVAGNDLVFWNSGHENNVYNIEGTLNLNTTRLSIDRGKFSLSGGTISGTGDGQGALDFYGPSQTTTIDVSGVSTVSATIRVRNESAVTIADFVVAEGSTLNFSGEKIGDGTMKKSGSGTMNFSGTVSAGKLELAGGETNFSGTVASEATINVSTGATLNWKLATDGGTLNQNIIGEGRVVWKSTPYNHATKLTMSDNFTGTLQLSGNFKSSEASDTFNLGGTSKLVLDGVWFWGSGSSTITADVLVGENKLIAPDSSRGEEHSNSHYYTDGGSIVYQGAFDASGKTVTITNSASNTFNGATTIGVLNLGNSASSTFNGDTTIGVLNLGNNKNSGGSISGAIKISEGGSFNFEHASATIDASLTFGDSTKLVLVDSNKEIADGASEDYRRTYQKDVQSALNISGQVALTGMTTYESAFWLATEISGKITGNGGLKFSGTANALWGKNAYLVLSNSENDFQGGITINRTDGVGIVRVTNGGALGSGAVNIEDTDDILSYRGTVGESFDTISNKIEGYGSIYIDSGKVAMRGDNSAFSGNISVNAGALAAGSASALGTGAVTVADGATLQISVQNVDAGTISLTGNARIVVDLADFKINTLVLAAASAY